MLPLPKKGGLALILSKAKGPKPEEEAEPEEGTSKREEYMPLAEDLLAAIKAGDAGALADVLAEIL